MEESLKEMVSEISESFGGKLFLSVDDICKLLDCDKEVVQNWIKRADPAKRPPRISVGREPRFPKKEFAKWLLQQQRCGELF